MHNTYHGRAPLPPPIITSPPAKPYQNHQNHHAPPLRSMSPASFSLSVPANLSPPPALLRPTSLPPPPVQNHLQHSDRHSDRPSSEFFLSQPAHLPPQPPGPNPAHFASRHSEHTTENLRLHGHMLGPTPLSNDMMLELMITQAIRDAAGFEILNAEAVEVLKKEHDDLADRASDLVPRLAREEKIREGARNMLHLYRENKTASLKAQEELASANVKVDGCATELWKITNRRLGLQRKILQHNSAVLTRGIRKMEDAVRREGKTTNANSVISGSSGRRSVTPDEWEAREDEFQQAFKLACQERTKERKTFEIALEEKDKMIIEMREKMESLEDSLKQVCENQTGPVPVQILTSDDRLPKVDASKEDSNERDVRELEVSQMPNETPNIPNVPKKTVETLQSSVPSSTALDIRTVIQDSMREIMMEQNRSAALVETERALRTELEGKIRGMDSKIRECSESLNSEISRREETEQKYAALQTQLAMLSDRAERDVALLEEARAKILWFETELEIRESQSVRLEELEQRAKNSEKELERVRVELENVSVTKNPDTDSSVASTETKDRTNHDTNGDKETEKTEGSAMITTPDSVAVEEMNIVLGQLGRTQADLAALQDYNSTLLNLLKRLDRELPTLSTSALGIDAPTSAVPSENSGEAFTEVPAREFTLDAFFQRVQSLAHENRVLLKRVDDLQKRNEALVIQTDEYLDRISATGKFSEESAKNLETQRARFEEEREKLLQRVRELETELSRVSQTNVEEVRKALEDSGRAEEVLRRDASLLKMQIEELETELVHRRKTAETFESDHRALEARAESATVKASRYRHELSEAQLKAFLDATAGLAIDGAEALKREFRRLMNDLRSEHAEEMRMENEERERLESFVAELREENEDVVAALAKAMKTVTMHKVSEPVVNVNRETSQYGIPPSHPPIVPPRPPLHRPVPSESQPAGNFRDHRPNDSFLSTLSTSTSFHSLRSTGRRDPDIDAEKIETNHNENHNQRHPISYTLRDNPYPFDDTPHPMHRPQGPPIPTPRTKLPSSPISFVRPGSTRNPPLRDVLPAEREKEPDDEFGPTPGISHGISPAFYSNSSVPAQDPYQQDVLPVPPPHGFHTDVPMVSSSSSQSHAYPYTNPQQQQQQEQHQQQQHYFQNEQYPHRPERNLPPIPHSESGTERSLQEGKKSHRFPFSLGGR